MKILLFPHWLFRIMNFEAWRMWYAQTTVHRSNLPFFPFIFCIKNKISIPFSPIVLTVRMANETCFREANESKSDSFEIAFEGDIKSVYIVEPIIISLVFLRFAHVRRLFRNSLVAKKKKKISILDLGQNRISSCINWLDRDFPPCSVHLPDSLILVQFLFFFFFSN